MAFNHSLQSNLDTHRFIKYIFLILASLIILFSFVGGAHAANGVFGGGDGTPQNPFIIEDAADLAAINSHLDGYFILGQNITLTGEWTPIGAQLINPDPFTGGLDGNGKTISNLTINSTYRVSGFFSSTNGAFITNLTFESAVVQSPNQYSGILTGYANNTTFDNIFITGDISGEINTGGFVGELGNSTLSNSSFTGNVSGGERNTGSFAGYAFNSTLSNSSAAGSVSGEMNIGGFAGQALSSTISNSSFTGNVNGKYEVGGFAGFAFNSTLSNSFAAGNVSGERNIGGFAGNIANNSTVSNSTATGNVSGLTRVGGFAGSIVNNSTALSSSAAGNVNGSGNSVGGFAGIISRSTVSNSSAIGNVSGLDWVGGFGGQVDASTVSNSFATENVSGNDSVGGFAGYAFSSTISNSFAAGNVSGNSSVGGFAGYIQGSTISNAFTTGNVEGANMTGGFAGRARGGEISNIMILNNFVNGTTENARSDFGAVMLSLTLDNLFVWNKISVNGEVGTLTNYSAVTFVTSEDVWRSYPANSIWSTFDANIWTLNSYGRFLLPVHTWNVNSNLGYAYVVADATYLMPNYLVIYDGNGHTSGSAPVDSMIYLFEENATVLGPSDLAKEGYTFRGWSTVKDTRYLPENTETRPSNIFSNLWDRIAALFGLNNASRGGIDTRVPGASYQPGDICLMTSSVVLFAQWEPGNGSTGGGNGTDNGTGGGGNGTGNGTIVPPGNGTDNGTVTPPDNGTGNGTVPPPTPPGNDSNGSGTAPEEDSSGWYLVILLFGAAIGLFIFFILYRRREDEEDEEGK
ncbi:MAG: InlB B-repeat-containing protein [Methanosarcinales archaeon]|jgi:hypothetical protein|nr:InlB B-repeat-containing protein [Methanosarcinales archaeon]